ncbi:nitroreductase family protein [Pelagicoccus sp. SDUM812003]|uniref:nitroreductase family protein n=1 Tax=Pelagicoccus sp. SDUM812003 TaxID=3041267 RepID=UPI00280EC845|nr:nitroreductase family protein [Pelagicoccus sp. SDUM812003]MDQ8205103.1 nitroreductase family protein [Pelagicoccus sp. SDUM812003]
MQRQDSDSFSVLKSVIAKRRTTKALASEPVPAPLDRSIAEEIVAQAAWAPFHKPASREHRGKRDLNSNVPWRAYLLDETACKNLRKRLIEIGDETKIPQLLAASSILIQITWLPNSEPMPAAGELFAPTLENMEHIAAASAAAQNILLAATAHDLPNYWSSGGALRSPEVFQWLGIPPREILIGALFLFPSDLSKTEVSGGKLRDKRGAPSQWSRWIAI